MAGERNLTVVPIDQSPSYESFFYILLQFLNEERLYETAHRLERDSKIFFDIRYFEEKLLEGKWDEAEWYLNGYFTNIQENRYAVKLFFEIRKQKYLEALRRREMGKAVEILHKEIKMIVSADQQLYKEIALLLSVDDFRENPQLTNWGDVEKSRKILCVEMRRTINNCPDLKDKLQFPCFQPSRLKTLINQCLTWQHYLCRKPLPNPTFSSILYDHNCTDLNMQAKNPSQLLRPAPSFTPQYFPSPPHNMWIRPPGQSRPNGGIGPSNIAESSQRPNQPDIQAKRLRPSGSFSFGASPSQTPQPNPEMLQRMRIFEELPKDVVMTLHQGSPVVSMDFNPIHQTFLLVGTSSGEISIWDLCSREKIHHRNFILWNSPPSSAPLQAALGSQSGFSVRCVVWNSDGCLFGVVYCKNLVHLYKFNNGSELTSHLEIDAHTGGVNDLAFSQPAKQTRVITCGDDMTIKVWSAMTGLMLHIFKGHIAPVYSICPQSKGMFQFVLSASIDGRVKIWTYDKAEPQIEFAAPVSSATSMSYTDDGSRLFSCGTSKNGETYLLEWSEMHGGVIRCFNGLSKQSNGIIQFHLANNRILVAGDEHAVKFWDMNHSEPLVSLQADGGLQPLPRVRFNKSGSLLAASANPNCFKILANKDGHILLSLEKNPCNTRANNNNNNNNLNHTTNGLETPVVVLNEDSNDTNGNAMQNSRPSIIIEPSQFQSLRLPDVLPAAEVHKLVYTSSGDAIVTLSSNAIHKVWKWNKIDSNPSGKAAIHATPMLWMPSNGTLMINQTGPVDLETHSFAITKNNSYILSASGGAITLYSIVNSKRMITFMTPPPIATAFAFHPIDNNKVAIGMDDSKILIYEPRKFEVHHTLKGHDKRITGLAFSTRLNILVSSGEDNQLCVWKMDTWEKLSSKYLDLPHDFDSVTAVLLTKTRVQFHCDDVELLVVHPAFLVVYDASQLEKKFQWVPSDSLIACATYSCDGQMIFASLTNGAIKIFTKTLHLLCEINPRAYLTLQSVDAYPISIAGHPADPSQIAVGLTDGGVHIFEPLEAHGQWGTVPQLQNGAIQIPASEGSSRVAREG